MCLSCNCRLPNVSHDDARHITLADLSAAADASGIDPLEAAVNIIETMELMVGDGAANWPP